MATRSALITYGLAWSRPISRDLLRPVDLVGCAIKVSRFQLVSNANELFSIYLIIVSLSDMKDLVLLGAIIIIKYKLLIINSLIKLKDINEKNY